MSDSEDFIDSVWSWICFISAVIACILFMILGVGKGQKWTRDEAIKVGVAEYYLDKDNNKQFRWKKPK